MNSETFQTEQGAFAYLEAFITSRAEAGAMGAPTNSEAFQTEQGAFAYLEAFHIMSTF